MRSEVLCLLDDALNALFGLRTSTHTQHLLVELGSPLDDAHSVKDLVPVLGGADVVHCKSDLVLRV